MGPLHGVQALTLGPRLCSRTMGSNGIQSSNGIHLQGTIPAWLQWVFASKDPSGSQQNSCEIKVRDFTMQGVEEREQVLRVKRYQTGVEMGLSQQEQRLREVVY